MKTNEYASGSCLCKAVNFKFPLNDQIFDACHCSMCRKWGGGPAFTVYGGTAVTFEDITAISTYKSSAWAERGFCKTCGTHIFYKLIDSKIYNFSLGTLQDQEKFRFHLQIFVDHKPKNYTFANQTDLMTEAQVIEKYSGK